MDRVKTGGPDLGRAQGKERGGDFHETVLTFACALHGKHRVRYFTNTISFNFDHGSSVLIVSSLFIDKKKLGPREVK